MLCANGAASGTEAGIRQAIYAYDHSQAYVAGVLAWAARYTVAAPSGLAAAAIAFAVRQLGKPYQWGATGPDSYDCSGLVYAAYAAAGIHLARTTFQWRQDGPRSRCPRSSLGICCSPPLPTARRQPRARRDVPRRRPDHPGPADRRGRSDRPSRLDRGRRCHAPGRPSAPHLIDIEGGLR